MARTASLNDSKESSVATTLFVLRGFVMILLLAFIFYVINPDGSVSIEKLQENFTVFQNMTERLKDINYNVPVKDRRPVERMKDFYKKQEKILLDQLVNTRTKFKMQHFIGTVMRDGFHSDLPLNAMWRGSKVEIGDNIAKLIIKEAEKGNQPPPTPSPSPSAISEEESKMDVKE